MGVIESSTFAESDLQLYLHTYIVLRFQVKGHQRDLELKRAGIYLPRYHNPPTLNHRELNARAKSRPFN